MHSMRLLCQAERLLLVAEYVSNYNRIALDFEDFVAQADQTPLLSNEDNISLGNQYFLWLAALSEIAKKFQVNGHHCFGMRYHCAGIQSIDSLVPEISNAFMFFFLHPEDVPSALERHQSPPFQKIWSK